jgi:opacity protein-like surface antigen
MKKLVLALTAVAAFTGSASAADLGARPYAKAPVAVAPAYNWTGFYIFGGGGGGLWAADSNVQTAPGAVVLTRDQRLVVAAGSERLVSVTIGSSTADGWLVSSVTASSETSVVP